MDIFKYLLVSGKITKKTYIDYVKENFNKPINKSVDRR